MKTGRPVIGVINQPFAEHNPETNTWRGQVYWGVCLDESKRYYSSTLKFNPAASSGDKNNTIVVSKTEASALVDKLKRQYSTFPAMGAGYKMLCVARGWALHYVTQKDSTYKWDTCAGHAILRAIGGGCLDLKAAFQGLELSYNEPRAGVERALDKWSNAGGLLVYRNQEELDSLLVLLKKE